MKTKRCSLCGEVKPLSVFTKRSRSKDGHESQCRVCRYNSQKLSPRDEFQVLGFRSRFHFLHKVNNMDCLTAFVDALDLTSDDAIDSRLAANPSLVEDNLDSVRKAYEVADHLGNESVRSRRFYARRHDGFGKVHKIDL